MRSTSRDLREVLGRYNLILFLYYENTVHSSHSYTVKSINISLQTVEISLQGLEGKQKKIGSFTVGEGNG